MIDMAPPSAPPNAGDLPAVDASRSVFINCPFDQEYERLFDALMLTIVMCGFLPRSALESGRPSISRMDRIFHALFTSNYSIHDLSRCRGEGENVLARFNMPLELGIAMSRGRAPEGRHDWFALVPSNAPYAQFISDLAGHDLPKYDGQEESIVRQVMLWLITLPPALAGVKPSDVTAKLPLFRERKARLKAEWGAEIPWSQLVEACVACARQ
jgi:hypothetical protein